MYRIFLVEDDRALALELQRQLEQCGNEVHIVSDFRAVLDEVRAYDPQLVLMDIMLPYHRNGRASGRTADPSGSWRRPA